MNQPTSTSQPRLAAPRLLRVEKLGRIGYLEAMAYQEKLVALRRQGEIPDTLLLLEHPPVFTIGRGGGWDNIRCGKDILAREGIQIYETSRGGNITYHGPGQLVGYPIIDLSQRGKDLQGYLRSLEEILIRTLQPYLKPLGLEAQRLPGYTGVWVGNEKIAAIGVAVKGWVTMHGFALNVNTNLEHFKLINPCGLDRPVTSLASLLHKGIPMDGLANQLIASFARVLNYSLTGVPEARQRSSSNPNQKTHILCDIFRP
ncbi:MAG: lipoyl(octanoyl) transferase LipB [Clostridia bacterium]|nr:lipoyl(octanoyl) transferase LipB [Clostridia bacterium]